MDVEGLNPRNLAWWYYVALCVVVVVYGGRGGFEPKELGMVVECGTLCRVGSIWWTWRV